jgi:hypothetical protein
MEEDVAPVEDRLVDDRGGGRKKKVSPRLNHRTLHAPSLGLPPVYSKRHDRRVSHHPHAPRQTLNP